MQRNTITGTGTVRYLGSLYLNVSLYLLGKAATDELKISSLGLKDNFKVIGTVRYGNLKELSHHIFTSTYFDKKAF